MHGLLGTKGNVYGPMAIWFYQLLLGLSHNIFVITLLKSLITTGLLLYALSRILDAWELDRRALVLTLLSPYIWFYQRNLWDNSLNLVFLSLAVGPYLHFLKAPNRKLFFVIFLTLTMAFLTHLMSIPIIAGLTLHFIWRRRDWIKSHPWTLLAGSAICLLLASGYLHYFLTHRQPTPATTWSVRSLLFPLLAARQWTAYDFNYFLEKNWQQSGVLTLVTGLTTGAFFFFALGIGSIRRHLKMPQFSEQASLVLLLLVMQLLFAWSMNLKFHPHYHNAFFPVAFTLVALGIDQWNYLLAHQLKNLPKIALWEKFPLLLACLLLISTASISYKIQINNGSRSIRHGPTSHNLWQLAKAAMAQQESLLIAPGPTHPSQFPEEILILRKLIHDPVALGTRAAVYSTPMEVQYTEPSNPQSGEIEIKKRQAP